MRGRVAAVLAIGAIALSAWPAGARHGSSETRVYIGAAGTTTVALGCVAPRAELATACFRLHGVERTATVSVDDLVSDPIPVLVAFTPPLGGDPLTSYDYCSVAAAPRSFPVPAGAGEMYVVVGDYIAGEPLCSELPAIDTFGTITASFV